MIRLWLLIAFVVAGPALIAWVLNAGLPHE